MNEVEPLEVDVKDVLLTTQKNSDDSKQDINEIEELCDKFLNIEGFKHLFDDQKLKEILEDLGLKAILDDTDLVKTLKENDWNIRLEIEEDHDEREYDFENETASKNVADFYKPANKNQEIKKEIEEYLEVDFQEIPIKTPDIKEEQHNLEFEEKNVIVSENSTVLEQIENRFSCALCEATFSLKGGLKKHFLSQHADSEIPPNLLKKPKTLPCPQCEETFKKSRFLERHLKKVHTQNSRNLEKNENQFSCELCEVTFSLKGALKKHFLRFHSDSELPSNLVKQPKPKTCPHCDEIFEKNKFLEIHIRKVHPEIKTQICSICESAFLLKGSLSRHMTRVHHQKDKVKKRHHCLKCDKSFYAKIYLDRHITIVHEGKIPYVCPHCGKGFKDPNGLKGHIATKHEENGKKFLCSLCPTTCLTKHLLKQHITVVHEKLMQYLCTQCGKYCITKGQLNAHVKKVHEKDPNEVKMFTCKICQKEFKTKHELNNHKLVVHEGITPIICPECPMGFARMINLKNHLNYVHTEKKFDCDKCGSKFKTKGVLNTHIKNVHENTGLRPHVCPHCEKTFRTKRSKDTHVKEVHNIFEPNHQLYRKRLTVASESLERTCPHCNQTLKNKYFLKKHILAEHE